MKEPTVADLLHIDDPVEAVKAAEESPVVCGSSVIGLPATQHFPEVEDSDA